MPVDLIAGGVTAIVGGALVLLGYATVEAGKGGFGNGPFPMVPTPRDNALIAIGLVVFLLGAALLIVAVEVIG